MFPVHVLPFRLRDLVAPAAGEQQQLDGASRDAIFIGIKRGQQSLRFLICQKAFAADVGHCLSVRSPDFCRSLALPIYGPDCK